MKPARRCHSKVLPPSYHELVTFWSVDSQSDMPESKGSPRRCCKVQRHIVAYGSTMLEIHLVKSLLQASLWCTISALHAPRSILQSSRGLFMPLPPGETSSCPAGLPRPKASRREQEVGPASALCSSVPNCSSLLSSIRPRSRSQQSIGWKAPVKNLSYGSRASRLGRCVGLPVDPLLLQAMSRLL